MPALQLDFRSHLPAYQQILLQVERLVSSGRLLTGARLPTVRELAAQLGVNFNTAARAYRLLDRAGLVSAQRGRGTYVLGQSAARRARSTMLRTLASEYVLEARRQDFSEAQIAQAVARQLRLGSAPRRPGDNHG